MTHDEVRDALPLFVVDADDREPRGARCSTTSRAARNAGARCRSTSRPPTRWPRRCRRSVPGPSCVRARWPPSSVREHRVAPPPHRRRSSSPAPPPQRARGGWAPWLAAAAALVAAVATAGLLQTRAEVSDLRANLAAVAGAGCRRRTERAGLAGDARDLSPPAGRDDGRRFAAGVAVGPATGQRGARPRPSSADRRTRSSSPRATCQPCRRRASISCGPWPVARRSARGPSCPTRAAAASSSPTCRPSPTRPDALAVTVEPEGGVPAPTGPKYLLGVPAAN